MSDIDSEPSGRQRVGLTLDIEGYEVEVTVHVDSIEREIRRLESENPELINSKGADAFDLSKFASVHCNPEGEKWDELLDAEFSDLSDDSPEETETGSPLQRLFSLPKS